MTTTTSSDVKPSTLGLDVLMFGPYREEIGTRQQIIALTLASIERAEANGYQLDELREHGRGEYPPGHQYHAPNRPPSNRRYFTVKMSRDGDRSSWCTHCFYSDTAARERYADIRAHTGAKREDDEPRESA
jgi:hypothetical protein